MNIRDFRGLQYQFPGLNLLDSKKMRWNRPFKLLGLLNLFFQADSVKHFSKRVMVEVISICHVMT